MNDYYEYLLKYDKILCNILLLKLRHLKIYTYDKDYAEWIRKTYNLKL